MNEAWMQEHWVFLIVGAAFLAPLVSTLITRAIDKVFNLNREYLTIKEFEAFKKECERNRGSCLNQQNQNTCKIEDILFRVEKELKVNRRAILWVARRLQVNKKDLDELDAIIERDNE